MQLVAAARRAGRGADVNLTHDVRDRKTTGTLPGTCCRGGLTANSSATAFLSVVVPFAVIEGETT